MLKELNGDDLCTIPKGSSKVCQICWSALEVFVHMNEVTFSFIVKPDWSLVRPCYEVLLNVHSPI